MLNTYTQQLPPSHIFSILYEDVLSLPLFSKEDVEDPNPPAAVEPKPPVDAGGAGLFNSASYRINNHSPYHICCQKQIVLNNRFGY